MASQFSSPREAMVALDALPAALDSLADELNQADVRAIVSQAEAALATLRQYHGEQPADPAAPPDSNGHKR